MQKQLQFVPDFLGRQLLTKADMPLWFHLQQRHGSGMKGITSPGSWRQIHGDTVDKAKPARIWIRLRSLYTPRRSQGPDNECHDFFLDSVLFPVNLVSLGISSLKLFGTRLFKPTGLRVEVWLRVFHKTMFHKIRILDDWMTMMRSTHFDTSLEDHKNITIAADVAVLLLIRRIGGWSYLLHNLSPECHGWCLMLLNLKVAVFPEQRSFTLKLLRETPSPNY